LLQIDEHGEIIACLGGDYIRTVFPFQDFLGAILDKLFVAFDGYGDEDLGFGFGGRDVEGDIVEVGDDLVN